MTSPDATALSGRNHALQRAEGRSWRTLAVRPGREEGMRLFSAAVEAEPRRVLRLIEVDFKDGSDGREFDWRLIDLHDPRRRGLVPDLSPAAPAPARKVPPSRGRARVPVRLYAGVVVLGAVLAAAIWFVTHGV
ncbi:hypothetical protein [Arenibaculum sp.]|uniref:hypothetical protein n=1 Tax=Arenibaculum sp. TaxID=2865862 RepID=UPI002E0E90C4|nr:hypothetical protein [Arenibaculum sp.]